MFRRYCLPWLVLTVYRLWSMTWRTTVVESDGFRACLASGRRVVIAHWHRDELAIVKQVGPYKIATITSHSKDGQLIDFVVRKLGGATAKGSSSKGGAGALRGMVKLVEAGYNASFAVDGPRGPIFKSKPGVFELSKLTGAAIIPVGVASRRRIIFARSWNKARMPKLFTRVVIVVGEPLEVDWANEPDLKSPQLAERLDERITEACRSAEAHGRKLIGEGVSSAGGFTGELE